MTTATPALSIPLPLQMLLVVLVMAGMLVAAGMVLWLLYHPHEVGDRLSAPRFG